MTAIDHPLPPAHHFEPVLCPDLGGLYAARAARLRDLAKGHDLADYLRLAADTVEAQAACLGGPVAGSTDPVTVAHSGNWPALLDRIIAQLAPKAPAAATAHLTALAQLPDAARRAAGLALTTGRFGDVDPAIAPFLWAAISVEVAQAARHVALPLAAEEPADCPICGTAPVASLIQTGDRQGFRYLHCALCDCEWHMVRAKCSNCGDAGQLDYLSFDTPEATVRAECCSACGSYLKVVSLERDPAAELVADDLATLALDDAAAGEGFARTGFNPFALPG